MNGLGVSVTGEMKPTGNAFGNMKTKTTKNLIKEKPWNIQGLGPITKCEGRMVSKPKSPKPGWKSPLIGSQRLR